MLRLACRARGSVLRAIFGQGCMLGCALPGHVSSSALRWSEECGEVEQSRRLVPVAPPTAAPITHPASPLADSCSALALAPSALAFAAAAVAVALAASFAAFSAALSAFEGLASTGCSTTASCVHTGAQGSTPPPLGPAVGGSGAGGDHHVLCVRTFRAAAVWVRAHTVAAAGMAAEAAGACVQGRLCMRACVRVRVRVRARVHTLRVAPTRTCRFLTFSSLRGYMGWDLSICTRRAGMGTAGGRRAACKGWVRACSCCCCSGLQAGPGRAPSAAAAAADGVRARLRACPFSVAHPPWAGLRVLGALPAPPGALEAGLAVLRGARGGGGVLGI